MTFPFALHPKFPEFLVEWKAPRNFQIPGKKDNLERLAEIFEMSFRKVSVPFDFEPEFSEILVEWNHRQTTLCVSVYEENLMRVMNKALKIAHLNHVLV